MSARILLVDGQQLVREGLARLFSSFDETVELFQAGTALEALDLLKQEGPDLLALDFKLRGPTQGLDLIAEATRRSPEIKVLVITGDHRRAMLEAALEAGAMSFVSKSSSPGELEQGMRSALEKHHYLAPAIADGPLEPNPNGETRAAELKQLTRREREVLLLIAKGESTREVAATLGIRPKTVEKHRAALTHKLKARGVADLTRFAIESELL